MSTTKHDLVDLPDDVRDLIEPHVDPSVDMLASISVAIAAKRDEAKAARKNSGIESIWRECEEAYIGIDNANRSEFADGRWHKPQTSDGPVTTTNKIPGGEEKKSTIFLRLTARYVDAGKAKLCEIVLPPNDKAFLINETPDPDLIKAQSNHSHVLQAGTNIPLMRDARPGEVPEAAAVPGAPMMATPSATGGAPAAMSPPAAAPSAAAPAGAVQAGAAGPPKVPLTVSDLAKEKIEIAHQKAKRAETRIYDWMVESKYNRQMRKVIFDGARAGSGVLKGPFPKSKRSIVVTNAKDKGINVGIKDTIKPSCTWVNFWNIFPDPSCGEDIHDGDYMLERDYLSGRGVRKLKNLTGYVGTQIDKVLLEGPQNDADEQEGAHQLDGNGVKKGRFEIWYYYGVLTRAELNTVCSASGKPLTSDDVPEDKEQVYAICTMINSTVVRATINPLDSGEFPYHIMCWQRRAGSCFGIGVGEQLRAPQRMLNAGVRALLNNAGKSAGSQIVLDQGAITPGNGNWVIEGDKLWYKNPDSPGQSVNDAFAVHEIPNVTDEMLKIIELAMKQAEEATSIPLVTQGQSGPTTPDTFGATALQDNNANQLLRDIAWEVDDSITEPFVTQSYEWLLLDPDVPDEEKGDFTINAQGSIALVEHAIQNQVLGQLPAVSLNPAYGLDPEKCMDMFLKSKRITPSDLQYTQAQKDAMAKQPPPKAPQVQAAEIAASVARDKIVAGQTEAERTLEHEQQLHESEQALAGQDTQNDARRIDAEHERTRVEQVVRLHEIQMKRETAMLDYANRRNISLDQAKKDLAKTAMVLNAQRELNAADNAVDLHKHHNPPPAEGERKPQPRHIPRSPAKPLAQAPGRAGNGKAFEQAQ